MNVCIILFRASIKCKEFFVRLSIKMRSQIFLPIIIIIFGVSSQASSKLIVIENQYTLKSSIIDYPFNTETEDVIWLFPHSIKLNVEDFHLNGHDGDFVLISEYPLIDEDVFKGEDVNGTDNYADQLAKSIISNQGLLLSWTVEKQIHIDNADGTFVLFHAEAKIPDVSPTHFEGFEINVLNYDDLRTTTTSTTPDPYIPPVPGQEIYISVFLNCMEPAKFLEQKEDFKEQIAKLATEYCKEEGIALTKGDILADEVNIPGSSNNANDRAGIHYCDITWPVYKTCVEVLFAITRLDDAGYYLINAAHLTDIWSKKASSLEQHGYCPYEPPGMADDLSALGWVAFFLGVILSLIALLGIAMLRITNTRTILDTKIPHIRRKKEKENIDERPQIKVFDSDNPIYNFFPGHSGKIYHAPNQELYPSGDYLNQRNQLEENAPMGFRDSYTKNPSFQEESAEVYAFDNSEFRDDDDNGMRADSPKRQTYLGDNRDGSREVILKRLNTGSYSETET